MTLGDFRTEIAALLSLNTGDSAELALIDAWVNEGVVYVCGQTEAKVTSGTTSLTADVGDYDLDDDILRSLWIQTNNGSAGYNSELEQIGPTDLLRLRMSDDSGSPTRYYALDGGNQLMVYPEPSEAETLTIYYVPRPAVLSASGNTPSEIPAEFHRLVTLYALWRGADYDDDQTSAQGARYKSLLDEGISDMRGRLNKKKGRRLPRATVAFRRRPLVHHRNDVY